MSSSADFSDKSLSSAAVGEFKGSQPQFFDRAGEQDANRGQVQPHRGRRANARQARLAWERRTKLLNVLFLFVPIAAGALYYFVFATSAYEVDSIVAIRNPSSASGSSSGGATAAVGGGMPSMAGSTSAERAIDESYAVVNYIQSREAYAELEKRIAFIDKFKSDKIDWLGRLRNDATFEQKYQYYLKHVNVSYDDVEGEVDLSTFGYDADTTYRMSKELSEMSEQLINQFNERSQADMIKLAQKQVDESNSELKATGEQITKFQLANGMIDPATETAARATIITALRGQSATKSAELGALANSTLPTSPRTVEIRNMLSAIDSQIQGEQLKLTGQTNALAPLIGKYKILSIDMALAQQKYTSAVAMLQSSQLQAERQKLYVVNIVSASVPVQPILPDRLKGMLSVVGFTFLAWLLARLVLSAIRDHRA